MPGHENVLAFGRFALFKAQYGKGAPEQPRKEKVFISFPNGRKKRFLKNWISKHLLHLSIFAIKVSAQSNKKTVIFKSDCT